MKRLVYRLMVKTHRKTGLQYLCITSKEDYEGYTGSGVDWKRHLLIYGEDYDTRVLIATYYRHALKTWGRYYSRLWSVTESPKWANRKDEEGYDFDMTGRLNVVVVTTGKPTQVTQEEFYKNRDNYITTQEGKVAAVDITTGVSLSVTQEEFYKNRDQYKRATDGMVSVIDIITGWSGCITVELYHNDLSGRYKRHTTGTVPVLGGSVTQEEFYENRDKYKTAQEGMVTVIGGMVTPEEFAKNRTKYKTGTDGMVTVINLADGSIASIPKETYHQNKDKFTTSTTDVVIAYDKVQNKQVRISKKEYATNKDRYYRTQGVLGRKGMYNKDGKRFFVKPDDERITSKELVSWEEYKQGHFK